MRAWLAAAVLCMGCGHHAAVPGADAPGGGSGDGPPPGFTTLISRGWNLTPGQQGYQCRRIQLTQDYWINALQPISPVGTHHLVVTIDPNDSSTGDYPCQAGSGTLNGQMVFASGVGTDALTFPDGIAVHLAAGTWINLNIHLFDTTDSPMSGESGVMVKTLDPASVVHEADMVFSGTFNITIPSDGQPHMASGGCNAPTDWHVFALWPHMHQIATHQTLVVTHGGVPTNMLDVPFTFAEQRNYPMAETIFHAGDTIQTTCTYVNTTGTTVGFGDSSTKEMCFTGMYKYPANSSTFGCVN